MYSYTYTLCYWIIWAFKCTYILDMKLIRQWVITNGHVISSYLLSYGSWHKSPPFHCPLTLHPTKHWGGGLHCSGRECIADPVGSFHTERFRLLLPTVLPLVPIVMLAVALCLEDRAEHLWAWTWSSAAETFRTKLQSSLEESSVSWELCGNFSRKTYLPDTMGSYFSPTEIQIKGFPDSQINFCNSYPLTISERMVF